MTRSRRAAGRARAGLAAACAGLALGCLGSSPDVRHFAMTPVAGPAAGGAGPLALVLGPVSFPRYLERPQMVTRRGSSELAFDEFRRWAGGFESNVTRVLAQDLESRLGGARVVNEGAAAPFPIAYRLSVDFQQFEGSPGDDRLVLRASWSLREEGGEQRVWDVAETIERPLAGGDPASLVQAHDAALGELADAIAARIAAARAEAIPDS